MTEKTEEVADQLYSFANLPFTQSTRDFIKELKNGTKNDKQFFGVYRDKKFDFNHWKQDLDKERIKSIERSCKNFMKLMNYTTATFE